MSPTSAPPRGLRDHNPGNLRHNPAIRWRNELEPDADGYCRFPTPADGLHALATDIHTKWARGLDAIAKIVPVYAPPTENRTAEYEKNVVSWTGWGLNERLDLSLPDNLALMVRAIVRQECGSVPYGVRDLLAAAVSALPKTDTVEGA